MRNEIIKKLKEKKILVGLKVNVKIGEKKFPAKKFTEVVKWEDILRVFRETPKIQDVLLRKAQRIVRRFGDFRIVGSAKDELQKDIEKELSLAFEAGKTAFAKASSNYSVGLKDGKSQTLKEVKEMIEKTRKSEYNKISKLKMIDKDNQQIAINNFIVELLQKIEEMGKE